MNRHRNPQAIRVREETQLLMRRRQVGEERSDGFAEAELRGDALVDRAIQQSSRFFRHPELPRAETLGDLFRSLSHEGHLEIVDDAGAVERDPLNVAALHQVDQERREPDFDHVRSEAPQDGALAFARALEARDELLGGRAPRGCREDLPRSRESFPRRPAGFPICRAETLLFREASG